MGGQLSKALGASQVFWVDGDVGADIVGKLFGNKEMRILMLGLDAAGKTSKSPWSSCVGSSFLPLLRYPKMRTHKAGNDLYHEKVVWLANTDRTSCGRMGW